jgi:exopolysaccharide production protein ExoZ
MDRNMLRGCLGGIREPAVISGERANARLDTLQIARGIAALSVALSHARLGTGAFVAPLPDGLERILSQGYLGVDFFFVLSGFIILFVHYDDPATPEAARAYALKRLIRVFVPYLPITALVVASYVMFPALSQGHRDWGWLTTWTLLPSAQEPALAAAWTLVHEMTFYALFLIFFVSRRWFAILIAAWSVALLAQWFSPHAFAAPALNVLFNPINIEFVFGLVCAVAFRVLSRGQGFGLIVAGAAVIAFFFGELRAPESDRIVFGLGIAMAVLGLSLISDGPAGLARRTAIRLGDASYALYLLHNPVISLTSRFAAQTPFLANWPASLLFSAAITALAALIYHSIFERPALALVRRRLLALRRAPTQVPNSR